MISARPDLQVNSKASNMIMDLEIQARLRLGWSGLFRRPQDVSSSF